MPNPPPPLDEKADELIHEAVMVSEVLEALATIPDGVVVDATLGGGGHSEALLTANPKASVFGIDRDSEAVGFATKRLAHFGERFQATHGHFANMANLLAAANHQEANHQEANHQEANHQEANHQEANHQEIIHQEIAGAIFDLGISSRQLDALERGFSYQGDGPLDMRFDIGESLTAAQIVNNYPQATLSKLIWRNANETHARRIARAIVAGRPFTTTKELAGAIAGSVPAAARRKKHPARRTFQALRIEVNQELESLELALTQAIDLLVPGGRCVVLAYHSGEDRIVKQCFKEAAGEVAATNKHYPPPQKPHRLVRQIWKGVQKPSKIEISQNPRSKSARMRAVEKLKPDI